MNRIKFLWTMLLVLMMSSVMVSCDKDDIDEFTASVVEHPWISDDGEVYDFYRSFNGVIYDSSENYDKHVVDRSFIWTETDNELTIGIDGFRNDNGEMVTIEGEDMVLITYHVESISDKSIVLTNGSESITLKAHDNR